MKNKNQSVSTLPDKHLSADMMYQYLEKQLPPAEQHEVELHLLECDLCSEALAGISTSPVENTRQQIFQINYHLKTRTQHRHPNQILQHLKNWGVTTVIFFIILLAALMVWYQVKQTNNSSSNKPTISQTAYTPAKPTLEPAQYTQYLRKNLRYPLQARQLGITGIVTISFKVNPDGSLTELTIIKGIRPDLNEEAIRLIKEGPAWLPARRKEKFVAETKTINISFELSD